MAGLTGEHGLFRLASSLMYFQIAAHQHGLVLELLKLPSRKVSWNRGAFTRLV